MDYIPWFKKQLEGTPITDFHRLAIGPSFSIVSSNADTIICGGTNLRFVNFEKFMRSSKEVDEPFIHASQATRIFYCPGETRESSHLVSESLIRSAPNVNAYEDPHVITASANEAALISTFVTDDEHGGADQV